MTQIEMTRMRSEATQIVAQAMMMAIVEPISKAVRFAVRGYIAHRDSRTLAEMPEHMLKDIGISRSEIDHAVRFGRFGE